MIIELLRLIFAVVLEIALLHVDSSNLVKISGIAEILKIAREFQKLLLTFTHQLARLITPSWTQTIRPPHCPSNFRWNILQKNFPRSFQKEFHLSLSTLKKAPSRSPSTTPRKTAMKKKKKNMLKKQIHPYREKTRTPPLPDSPRPAIETRTRAAAKKASWRRIDIAPDKASEPQSPDRWREPAFHANRISRAQPSPCVHWNENKGLGESRDDDSARPKEFIIECCRALFLLKKGRVAYSVETIFYSWGDRLGWVWELMRVRCVCVRVRVCNGCLAVVF